MKAWPSDAPSPLWMALCRESFSAPRLTEAVQADVAVIGGGYAGISAAIELRQRGYKVVLLEATKVGYGASGRANGQVIGALTRHGPAAIRKVWPGERGECFIDLVRGSVDVLYGLIDRYRIDCDARRTGWLQPAHSPGRAKRAADLAAQWAAAGAPTAAVSAADMQARLGTSGYFGGWEHRASGHINPYAFAVGLARGAASDGVRIYENSPAIKLSRSGNVWVATTPGGTVTAAKVALTTAAYSGDLWPELRRSIVSVTSYQAATRPLGAAAGAILPNEEAASDTRMDLRYFRKDREGRLVSGAALALQWAASRRLPALVERRLRTAFPALPPNMMADFWGGRIAMTLDPLPHLHRRADGLCAWIGCNGRGLALACAMAPVLADALDGIPSEKLAVRPTEAAPVPFHFAVSRFARLILPWYRFKDTREV